MNTNKTNNKYRILCTMHIEEEWKNGCCPFVAVNQGVVEDKDLRDYVSATIRQAAPLAFISMYAGWTITSSFTELNDPMYVDAEKNMQKKNGMKCKTYELFAEVERIADGLKSKLIITFRAFDDSDMNN